MLVERYGRRSAIGWSAPNEFNPSTSIAYPSAASITTRVSNATIHGLMMGEDVHSIEAAHIIELGCLVGGAYAPPPIRGFRVLSILSLHTSFQSARNGIGLCNPGSWSCHPGSGGTESDVTPAETGQLMDQEKMSQYCPWA
jgi:hypothetical protein